MCSTEALLHHSHHCQQIPSLPILPLNPNRRVSPLSPSSSHGWCIWSIPGPGWSHDVGNIIAKTELSTSKNLLHKGAKKTRLEHQRPGSVFHAVDSLHGYYYLGAKQPNESACGRGTFSGISLVAAGSACTP